MDISENDRNKSQFDNFVLGRYSVHAKASSWRL